MILSYIRTIVLYLLLIVVIRVMGKRQVGQMEPSEFVVTMLVANLAAIPMQDGGIPLFSGLVPILTVLGVELLLSWGMLKSQVFRALLCGKPVILIQNGKILQSSLRQTRITIDELMGHLREKDVMDVRTVQYAILETNGSLTVFPYPRELPASAKDAKIKVQPQILPICLIEDGKLLRENLALSGKDDDWLMEILRQRSAGIDDTFLLTLTGDTDICWIGKEWRK